MKSPNRRREQVIPDRLQKREHCLPSKVEQAVPECAHSCILQFIQKNYQDTSCGAIGDLDHLCATPPFSGQTFGEASLQCVASFCSAKEVNSTVLLSAYRVCEGVKNAVPNTASVINATIQPAATPQAPTVQNAVPEITAAPTPDTDGGTGPTGVSAGGASSTSMIISGDGMSVTMEIMMSPSASTASTASSPTTAPSPSMTMTGSNFVPEQTNNQQDLSMGQVAGIAAGAGVAAVIIVSVIFLYCRRRRRAKQDKAVSAKEASVSDVSRSRTIAFSTNSATKVISPNKRRSFWRMSIKPEDIGVAVSVKSKNRNSTASDKSMLKYMPAGNPFTDPSDRLSWPAFGKETGPSGTSRDSISTIFDDDIEQQPVEASIATRARATSITWHDRSKTIPPALQLDNQRNTHTPPPNSGGTGEESNTVSLTPTYDNGHFSLAPNEPPVQMSIAQTLAASSLLPPQTQTSRLSLEPAIVSSPKRNRLQKKFTNLMSPKGPPKQSITNFAIGSPLTQVPENVSQPFHPDAISPLAPRPLQSSSSRPFSQASNVPKGIRMVRPESSALVGDESMQRTTDSVSSDGLTSNYSLNFPVPPSRAVSRDGPGAATGLGLGALRGSIPLPPPIPSSPFVKGRRQDTMYESIYSTDSTGSLAFGDQQLSPNSRAKVTPTMKNSVGDLFFKVEMR